MLRRRDPDGEKQEGAEVLFDGPESKLDSGSSRELADRDCESGTAEDPSAGRGHHGAVEEYPGCGVREELAEDCGSRSSGTGR